MKRALVLLLLVGAGCGGKAVFRLSSDENNAFALDKALAQRQLPATPTPVNDAHQPRLYALANAAGANKTILALDLASGNVMWKADAEVKSRIAVGGDFIVALEGNSLVARDQARGQPRWRHSVPGTYVGHAADRERAYVVWKSGSTWWLAALDGAGGKQLWKADAAGVLGAPQAHGGVVYVPFLSQWLTLVDGRSGRLLTRVRGIDEQISTLRVTSTTAYYGSKQGMFELDGRSSTGLRAEATYGKVAIPAQLERTTYARDAYDDVQAAYTANDRTRVLWATTPVKQGPMAFAGGTYAIHHFRFLLGFGADGEVRWAYSHPRVELVASDHTGAVVVGLSASGEVVAVDPVTGAVRAQKSLGTSQQVLGGTFDADGWAPAAEGQAADPVAALVGILRDRDARFDRVKELAAGVLAKMPGPDVTRHLLETLADNRAPQRLKDAVVEQLVARRDPSGLPALTAQLAVRTDYLAKTEPDALGATARAIAGLEGLALDTGHVEAALAALEVHLDAPTTPTADLAQVIGAMAAIGGGAERQPLASHLLLYHADDLGGEAAWQRAISIALARKGGPGERAVLRRVAGDPRSRPGLASAIRDALGVE
ncbi:MAG: PQQ-binding-like beta-propeller repeat protein [Deltaproteobacteria bacterium]|nr:PQQ-binding-like beta-propeller repeat protein [Deltaproteobacteria bacterium]MCW5805337.1 PQQ-binding-like beta-propeller repeat protein [Deltaproteobacteria bacterium]